MERKKQVNIEGIYFHGLSELFQKIIKDIIVESGLPEEKVRKKLNSKAEKVIEVFKDVVSSEYLKRADFKLHEFKRAHFRNQRTILDSNQDSFYFFLLYINSCSILYEKCINSIRRKRLNSTLKIGISLYGLILRRAQQIASALIDGYVDTAMILWRSMYEYVVTLLVMATEDDDQLSDRYYDHSVRGSRKKIVSYTDNHKKLKFRPLPKTTFENLAENVSRLEAAYGKDFIQNEYGWADDLFPGKQKASLRLLEERVEMSMYRPFYLICSEHAHSSFNVFSRHMQRGKIILPAILLQESEQKDFIDPMQFTISILEEVTDYILYEFSVPHEYEINNLLLRKIFESMQDTFSGRRRKRNIQ